MTPVEQALEEARRAIGRAVIDRKAIHSDPLQYGVAAFLRKIASAPTPEMVTAAHDVFPICEFTGPHPAPLKGSCAELAAKQWRAMATALADQVEAEHA